MVRQLHNHFLGVYNNTVHDTYISTTKICVFPLQFWSTSSKQLDLFERIHTYTITCRYDNLKMFIYLFLCVCVCEFCCNGGRRTKISSEPEYRHLDLSSFRAQFSWRFIFCRKYLCWLFGIWLCWSRKMRQIMLRYFSFGCIYDSEPLRKNKLKMTNITLKLDCVVWKIKSYWHTLWIVNVKKKSHPWSHSMDSKLFSPFLFYVSRRLLSVPAYFNNNKQVNSQLCVYMYGILAERK